MRTIETEITVPSPAEAVWQVLTDFDAYAEWNPFLVSAEGTPEVGERLEIRFAPPGRRPMTMRPTVRVAEEGRRLVWLGHLVVPGLFDGRHEFRLEPVGAGTRVVQREDFRGVLVPLMGSKLFDQTEQGFVAMNEALAERSARGHTRAEGAA